MATEVIQIGNSSIEYFSYQCPDGDCCDVTMGHSKVDGATAEIQDVVSAYQDGSLTLQDQINATEDAMVHFTARNLQASVIAQFWNDKVLLCQSHSAFWSCANHPETCNTSVSRLKDRRTRSWEIADKFSLALQGMQRHLNLLLEELQTDVNTTAMETQVIALQTQSEVAIVNAEDRIMDVKQQEFKSNLQKYVVPIALIILGIMFFRKK